MGFFLSILLFSFLSLGSPVYAWLPPEPEEKEVSKPEIQWLTLEQALEKSKKQPRKIIIDIYTDWCGYCKQMDKKVYQHPEVVAKLNRDFYAVKLNAEQRGPITVNGTKYHYQPQYKAHELALALLQGQMSYPSTVFLNEKQQVMERVAGYVPPKDFLHALGYIAKQ